ncbi:hypothetical protein J41TS4_19030 [Paenibacillus apis]|uniref:Uncharacterized protein n=1 Tax=Paenibacillus apis TaxID=1792174 RepID=A0A920CK32_9BACL|nr:hypothetical protein J41TS4_19030 [Paenibacillus apis]
MPIFTIANFPKAASIRRLVNSNSFKSLVPLAGARKKSIFDQEGTIPHYFEGVVPFFLNKEKGLEDNPRFSLEQGM